MSQIESQIQRLVAPKNASPARFFAYPAIVGRQVYCGFRQSIPSSKKLSCADDIATASPAAVGQMNRPRSNLFE
jgi:hypothetical protein